MALLTKKDFAGQTGQTTKTLAVYIKRGKVQAEDNDLIDTNKELNKAFMLVHSGKADKKAQRNRIPDFEHTPPPPQIPRSDTWVDPKAGEDNEIPDLPTSEKRYKHALAKKTEASEELERLRIEKLKGDVIPTEPIEGLVFQFKQHIITQQKITYEAFLAEISHKYSISPTDMAYYRGFFIKGLNSAMISATDGFKMNLDTTLAEFAVKRGVR